MYIRLYDILRSDSRAKTQLTSGQCRNASGFSARVGGGERDRTDDPLLAKQVLSQLSYTPVI